MVAQFCKTDEWGDNCRNQVDGFDLQSNQAVTPKLPGNGYKVRQYNNIIEIRHLTVGKCDSINKAPLLVCKNLKTKPENNDCRRQKKNVELLVYLHRLNCKKNKIKIFGHFLKSNTKLIMAKFQMCAQTPISQLVFNVSGPFSISDSNIVSFSSWS